jgi:hypothetical protein
MRKISDTGSVPSRRDRLSRRSSERGRSGSQSSTEPASKIDPSRSIGDDAGGDPPTTPRSPTAQSSADGLSYLFQMTQTELDIQFRIAERIDNKARGLFAITAAIFTAAQALALREDILRNLGSEKDTVMTIAVIAGVLVGLSLLATAWTMFIRRDKRVEADALLDWLGQLEDPQRPNAEISAEMIQAYITLMHRRQEQNVKRASKLTVVQVLCLLAVIASVAELVLAVGGLT